MRGSVLLQVCTAPWWLKQIQFFQFLQPRVKEKDEMSDVLIQHLSIWSLMLIPCCVSVRIQMVLVAPVRTSSSTNQIHVTHTEERERTRERERQRERQRERSQKESRWGNLKESGEKRYSRPLFLKLFFSYSANAETALRYNQRVLRIPLPRTHAHGLSAKKPLLNYLPLAKALQPRSNNTWSESGQGERSEWCSERGDILLFVDFIKKETPMMCRRSRFW